MFKNYFKVAVRNLVKNKVYSLVNIFGLVLGLACSMVIIIYVLYEFSYDRFHKNADRIFRLGRETRTADSVIREPLSSAPAARTLMFDFPEVVKAVRFRNMGQVVVKYGDSKFYEQNVYFVDASVFDIFTFPLLSGDPRTALVQPYSVVISAEMAKKYFGADDPAGKVLRFNNQNDYLVTGVMSNLRENSHFDFDMLCSIETLYAQKNESLDNWLSFSYFTYLLLKENVDYKTLEQKLPAFIQKYIGDDYQVKEEKIDFFLHPLAKIHLYSHLEGYSPGRITQVYSFTTLSVLILLIACINFMNLSTARSVNRAKEVGVRKVVGANRGKLIGQFISESLVLSLIALIIAFFLVEMTLPVFSAIVGQPLQFNYFERPLLVLGFIGLAVLVGLVSGSYPAFYLSRFQAIHVLKDNLIPSKRARLRSTLVIVQFFISTVFIIQTLILKNQIQFLKEKEIAFDKKHVVVIPLADESIKHSIKAFKKELKNITEVAGVAATSTLPGWNIPRSFKIPEGYTRQQMQLMDEIYVDQDFIPTLKIEMAAGRNFSEGFAADEQDAIIVNETAVHKFGWDNPIGRTIQYSIGTGKFASGTVYGVVKDFHLASLYRVIEPLCISNNPEHLNYLLIRIQPEKMQQTIEQIKTRWSEMFPNLPFDYSFLEHSYDHYFRVLENVMEVFQSFTFLAILIACLGIFALATFTVERRTKEIGIRKVLGATTFGIIIKLTKEITRLVGAAILLAWLFMKIPIWDLHTFFPYLAEIGFSVYLIAMLLVVFIALVTVSFHSIKAALANPVESLRYE